jgi:hypothetical protein
MGFATAPSSGATWFLRSPTNSTCLSNEVNQIYCYGAGSTGILVSAPYITVDAKNVTWTNTTPTAAVDYLITGGSSLVDAPASCTAAIPTCP